MTYVTALFLNAILSLFFFFFVCESAPVCARSVFAFMAGAGAAPLV